ncbi:ethanolamine utilization protein EutH, partial [Clostridium perfringens]
MEIIGKIVVYIIMFCAVVGAIASIVKEESELGNQFLEGINSIGAIFLPVAGIMASAPFITKFVSTIFGPLFQAVGADPAMAATTFIAVDMGGYQLAEALASTKESWIMAMTTGYMAGATIVFSIPVGLKMIGKKDHKYLALGMMSGILTIPIGVLTSSLFIALNKPFVRDIISTDAASTYQLLL